MGLEQLPLEHPRRVDQSEDDDVGFVRRLPHCVQPVEPVRRRDPIQQVQHDVGSVRVRCAVPSCYGVSNPRCQHIEQSATNFGVNH